MVFPHTNHIATPRVLLSYSKDCSSRDCSLLSVAVIPTTIPPEQRQSRAFEHSALDDRGPKRLWDTQRESEASDGSDWLGRNTSIAMQSLSLSWGVSYTGNSWEGCSKEPRSTVAVMTERRT